MLLRLCSKKAHKKEKVNLKKLGKRGIIYEEEDDSEGAIDDSMADNDEKTDCPCVCHGAYNHQQDEVPDHQKSQKLLIHFLIIISILTLFFNFFQSSDHLFHNQNAQTNHKRN